MTKIYLIRHAEAEGDLFRRIHGHTDSRVSVKGKKQIEVLRQRFADERLNAVYTSDLDRAVQTARALSESRGLPLQKDARFREMHFGPWEDQTYGQIQWEDPEGYSAFCLDPTGWRLEGAETYHESTARFLAAMNEALRHHEGGSIAIVTHGAVLHNVLTELFSGTEAFSKLGHSDNTAVTLLEYENGTYRLVYANNNDHLDENISTFAREHWWKGEPEKDVNLWFKPYDLDHDAYCAMRHDAWQTIYGTLDGLNEEGFYEELCNIMQYHSYAGAYAMHRDEIAGFIQLSPSRRRDIGVGYVSFVYMCPEFRNKGIGAQLIGYAVSQYRMLGRRALQLGCAKCNFHGQHFYEKLGFKVVGTVPGLTDDLLLEQLEL